MVKSSIGGMIINPKNVEETILQYFRFSTISQLSSGSFGITYLSELLTHQVNLTSTPDSSKPSIEPFLTIDVGEKFKTPVTSLVIKVCLLNPTINRNGKQISNNGYYYFDDNGNRFDEYSDDAIYLQEIEIAPVSAQSFDDEINIQTDIYLKTMKYLQPLCPGITYSTKIVQDNNNELLNLLNIPKPPASCIKKYQYGIIVMSVANGVTAVNKTNTTNQTENKRVISMCLFALIELALETGYTHGDHHFGNIMFDPNNTEYFKGGTGRVLLIDFGRTTKIPPKQMATFTSLCASKKYTDALMLLCSEPVANPIIVDTQYADLYYGWACGNYNGRYGSGGFGAGTNDTIARLFANRELAINDNVEIMNRLHESKPDIYPLLPLSNAIKNQLYNGVITGGKRKTRKMRHKLRKLANRKKTIHKSKMTIHKSKMTIHKSKRR